MEHLCHEIIQLVFYKLNDPGPLTRVSKRFYQFSQDPYVRAHYFLTRHGEIQAMFWALGRGKVVTNRVLDILLASGAHLSRYLVQLAIHHYFRTTAHFIKTTWVRSVPFPIFNYFLKLGADIYGDIPIIKGSDDGSLFGSFLKESKLPSNMKSICWEEIRDILEKYKFIPFSNMDPIMAQYPLALAIEPRLLPLAVANGFHMDTKYRDFVFRKIFERLVLPIESRTDEIIHNVRELCKLESKMFLSRTVAAEVCMEAKLNESGYAALKKLDESGELLFELSSVVEDLIKLFIKTRSVSTVSTIQVLRHLYTDFPSSDPTVRLVLLLTVFLSHNCHDHTFLKSQLEPLGLLPLTRKDIYNTMVNSFVERYGSILAFAKAEVGLSGKEVIELVKEVAVKCLEIGCKGKMLLKLLEGFPFLHDTIAVVVMQRHQIGMDDLPLHEDEKLCAAYEAKLCRDFIIPRFSVEGEAGVEEVEEVAGEQGNEEIEEDVDVIDEDGDDKVEEEVDWLELGRIGQDTLTTMIRKDEATPTRSRRRIYYYSGSADVAAKLSYPMDSLQVGKLIKDKFGIRSRVTAVFMTHAVINDNSQVLHQYMPYTDTVHSVLTNHVPVTLKHFKLLARLGRAPSWCLYHDIELGAEFYFTEDDYLKKQLIDALYTKQKIQIKTEAITSNVPSSSNSTSRSSRRQKRPRRNATVAIKSYLVPDSDDDAIMDGDYVYAPKMRDLKPRRVETSLQKWIKQLSILWKDEQRKYKEKKKRIEKSTASEEKVRVPKSDFFKSLSTNLRILRKTDLEKRVRMYGHDVEEEDSSDSDSDEYRYRTTRGKKRKTTQYS